MRGGYNKVLSPGRWAAFEGPLWRELAEVGSHLTATSQYSSTTSYQVPYHIRSLLFESDSRVSPEGGGDGRRARRRRAALHRLGRQARVI